jgi:hypothetical protein
MHSCAKNDRLVYPIPSCTRGRWRGQCCALWRMSKRLQTGPGMTPFSLYGTGTLCKRAVHLLLWSVQCRVRDIIVYRVEYQPWELGRIWSLAQTSQAFVCLPVIYLSFCLSVSASSCVSYEPWQWFHVPLFPRSLFMYTARTQGGVL